MKPRYQSPTGMHDVFGEDQKYLSKIYETVSEAVSFYNFEKIDTPILEEADLFLKGIGVDTEVVQKQMFSFKTKGGDNLALRPEGTAGIVRSYLQNGFNSLPKPIKLWYFGPFFRYEKPQLGRFRQFWQFGIETIGEQDPVRDAEIVQIFYRILQKLKIKKTIIEVNSIGGKCCRPYYKKLLTNYLKSRANGLCANCRKRVKVSPLGIFDCKEEKCQRIVSQAPQIIDHLCQNCHQHFKGFLEFLDEIAIPYNLNPYLVRGLDYYTRTVFEIFPVFEEQARTDQQEPVQEIPKNALGGGGRYDGLIKLLGGKSTPAVGAALGIDRIIWLMKKEGIKIGDSKEDKVFLAQLGGLAKKKALKIVEDLRRAKIPVMEAFGRDSLKSQLTIADKEKVKYALILGQKEALQNTIMIRNMETGEQKELKTEKIVKEVKKMLNK